MIYTSRRKCARDSRTKMKFKTLDLSNVVVFFWIIRLALFSKDTCFPFLLQLRHFGFSFGHFLSPSLSLQLSDFVYASDTDARASITDLSGHSLFVLPNHHLFISRTSFYLFPGLYSSHPLHARFMSTIMIPRTSFSRLSFVLLLLCFFPTDTNYLAVAPRQNCNLCTVYVPHFLSRFGTRAPVSRVSAIFAPCSGLASPQ